MDTKAEPLLQTFQDITPSAPEAGSGGWKEKAKPYVHPDHIGYKKFCAGFCGCILMVLFILTWILQGILYWWATVKCSPSALDGYAYPGGEASDHGGPGFNLVPRISLISERPPSFWGQAFDNIPASETSADPNAAPTGVWWRTWGPFFTTYTYVDVVNSKTTLYVRHNLLRLGMSHRIGRCDGKEKMATFTEGGSWFMNRIRYTFGMNQAMTFKMYLGDDLIATAEETSRAVSSLTFLSYPSREELGSAIMTTRNFHGQYDQWLVRNQQSTPLPYWFETASTLLFAFHELNGKAATSAQFLAANASGLSAQLETNASLASESVRTESHTSAIAGKPAP